MSIKSLRGVYYGSEFYQQEKTPKVHQWGSDDERALLKMIEDGMPWECIQTHFANIKTTVVRNKYYCLLRKTRTEFKHSLETDQELYPLLIKIMQ